MIRKKSKGGIFFSLFVMLAVYLFAVGMVIIFFYFYKFHITITMIDEYRWNKIQVVPLSLLSMELDGEKFVSKMNKVYYGSAPIIELNSTKSNVTEQLYYVFGDRPPSMGFIVSVGDITVSESPFPDCGCKTTFDWVEPAHYTWTCQGGCGPKEGQSCKSGYVYDYIAKMSVPDDDETMCFLIGRVEYKGIYPFPLTFNGTGKFVDKLTYSAVEYK